MKDSYTYIYEFKQNETYRESFFKLTKQVFGIDFSRWYEQGHWQEQYRCHAFYDESKQAVIANVSVNLMDTLIDGKRMSAVQIGTVMTHPDYRKQGLSAKLLNKVLKAYEACDLIFLFANQSVLEFYPKFGFQAYQEHQFKLNWTTHQPMSLSLKQLNPLEEKDYALIRKVYNDRRIPTKRIDVANAEHLLAFYCLNVFTQDTYYIEELNAILIYKEDEDKLHLFDVFSSQEITYNQIFNSLVKAGESKEIVLYFTPEPKELELTVELADKSDDVLFIKSNHFDPDFKFRFPFIAHA